MAQPARFSFLTGVVSNVQVRDGKGGDFALFDLEAYGRVTRCVIDGALIGPLGGLLSQTDGDRLTLRGQMQEPTSPRGVARFRVQNMSLPAAKAPAATAGKNAAFKEWHGFLTDIGVVPA